MARYGCIYNHQDQVVGRQHRCATAWSISGRSAVSPYPTCFVEQLALVLTASLSVSFAVLYRFAPNLHDHEWRWSTPGALCALLLWIGSTFAARVYFDHVNYARSYGHLSGVVMLLLWLYVSNGAILIGGEMNSPKGRLGVRTVQISEKTACWTS